jgi:hypothetical protein
MNSIKFACWSFVIWNFVDQSFTFYLGLNETCANGGTCLLMNENNLTCSCMADYTGRLCEILVTNTTSSNETLVEMSNSRRTYLLCSPDLAVLCKNGATCLLVDDELECACANGYTGYYCEINTGQNMTDQVPFVMDPNDHLSDQSIQNMNIETCSSDYDGVCLNGGTCYIINQGLECACLFGYSGFFCELSFVKQSSNDTNESLINIKKSEAVSTVNSSSSHLQTSTDSVALGRFTTTMPDYADKHDVYYFVCHSRLKRLCQNGGTCLYQDDNLFCICKNGYSGLFCETEI